MRFLQLKILLPLIVGVLIIVSIFVGMAFLGSQTERVRMEVVEQPLVLMDITKELDLCFFQRARSSFISCNRDEFSFSDSYGVIYAGWGGRICQGGRRVEKISDVFIMFSEIPDPSRCSFRLTVQFEDGEIFSRKVDLERRPRPVPRYELVLANPGNNMPIAGIIYDHETEDVFYIVTKLTY